MWALPLSAVSERLQAAPYNGRRVSSTVRSRALWVPVPVGGNKREASAPLSRLYSTRVWLPYTSLPELQFATSIATVPCSGRRLERLAAIPGDYWLGLVQMFGADALLAAEGR